MNARNEFIAKWVFDDKGFVIGTERKEDLIRCRDCKKRTRCMTVAEYYYCSMTGALTDETDYCSWAEERKEE